MSGEETPIDNALLTRAIIIQLRKRKEDKQNDIYYKLQGDIKKLSRLAYNMLTRRVELIPKILDLIEQGMKYFCQTYSLDQRIALNYATALAGYFVAFGENDKLLDFTAQYALKDKRDKDMEQIVNIFFDGLGSLHASGKFNEQFYRYDPVKKELYFFMAGAYNIWSPEYQRVFNQPPFKMQAIRNYLMEEPFYKTSGPKMIGKTTRWALIFDVDQLPNEAKFMLDLREYGY